MNQAGPPSAPDDDPAESPLLVFDLRTIELLVDLEIGLRTNQDYVSALRNGQSFGEDATPRVPTD